MNTKTELTPEVKSKIRLVVEEVVSQKLYSVVCGIDDNDVYDEIRNMLFDKNILDGSHYTYNYLNGKLPPPYKFEKVKSDLTDYLMDKFEGI